MKLQEHRSCLCFDGIKEKENFVESLFKLSGHLDFFRDAKWDPVSKTHFLNGQIFEVWWKRQWKDYRYDLKKTGILLPRAHRTPGGNKNLVETLPISG